MSQKKVIITVLSVVLMIIILSLLGVDTRPLIIFVILLISLALYFLPTIIGRKHKNAAAIFLLNLFLGWTFVGWVVSLVWAVTK